MQTGPPLNRSSQSFVRTESTMYSDDQLLPISALQHLVFCSRQCALIHVERVWTENVLTVEGQRLHKKTNTGRDESHLGIRVARSLDLVSRRLGLVGMSDVVEFKPAGGEKPATSLAAILKQTATDRFDGWTITPIEYKRGKPKTNRIWGDCDRVQLCAQMLCLEEMLSVMIPAGQIFYGEQRRRLDVDFDAALREKTETLCVELHQLLNQTQLPSPVNDHRCKRCSLIEQCMPEQTQSPQKASRWIARQIALQLGDDQ